MKKLSNKYLIYNDASYNHAVNYQHMYNSPVTLNFGEKHNRTKYILSSGNCDSIELWQDGIFIYVVSQNSGLEYIGMDVINTEIKQIEGNVYLSGNDLTVDDSFPYDLLNKESEDQIKILCEYL